MFGTRRLPAPGEPPRRAPRRSPRCRRPPQSYRPPGSTRPRRRSCWNGACRTPEELLDLESNFSQVAVELFGSGTVEGTLQRIVDLAERTVDGCDAAGIARRRRRPGHDGRGQRRARRSSVDQLQIAADEGPCLDAAVGGSTFYAADLVDDARWPTFAPVGGGGRRPQRAGLLAVGRAAERPQPLRPAPVGVRRHRPGPGPALRHPRPPRPRLRRGARGRRQAGRQPRPRPCAPGS